MISIITYISVICGGLMIFLLLLSLLSGLDLNIDLGDIDTDTGGLGVLKSVLTFISVCLWVVRVVLLIGMNPYLAVAIGILAGAAAVVLLSLFLRWLLSQQSFVNWSPHEAINQKGKVYLKIPHQGEGIVHVAIKGTVRELKAKTDGITDIPTGTEVYISDYADGYAIVQILK